MRDVGARCPSDLVDRLAHRSREAIREEDRWTLSLARADARWWLKAIAEELARFGHYEGAAEWLVDHAELTADNPGISPCAGSPRWQVEYRVPNEKWRRPLPEIPRTQEQADAEVGRYRDDGLEARALLVGIVKAI